MSSLPPVLSRDRVIDAVLIPVLSILQACMMGLGAFATRDAFAALHLGAAPTPDVLIRLLGSGLAVALLGWGIKQRGEALGQSYAIAMRLTLYRHIAGMELTTLENRRAGALSLRFVGDLGAARNWFGRGLPLALSAVFVLPGAGVVLWLLHPLLALAAFIPLFCAVIAMLMIAIGLGQRHRSLRRKRARISISMIERIAIAPLLDLMGRTEKELEVLAQHGAALRRNALDRAAVRNGLTGMMDAGAAIAGTSVVIVAGNQGLGAGLVAAALALIAILITPLRALALVWDRYCAWRVAREKAGNLLRQPSRNRATLSTDRAPGIMIEGPVPGTLAAGRIHWIAPDNGPETCNLLRHIAGLDDAPDMKVLFDGSPERPTLAFLGEQPTILQGSIRRAVTLGLRPRPGSRQIMTALDRFSLSHLAPSKQDLATRISEAGRNLPPHDRFRLELARAALSGARLILIEGHRLEADESALNMIRRLHGIHRPTIIIRGCEPDVIHGSTGHSPEACEATSPSANEG